jgi:hypothetical protein
LWTELLAPVVPRNAFALTGEGATFVHVSDGERPGVSAARHFDWPDGMPAAGPHGTPVFERSAFSDIVRAASKLLGGRVSRACVTFPDVWAKTMTLDFDMLPPSPRERAEMVAWKVKKLLSARVEDFQIVFREIESAPPPAAEPAEGAGISAPVPEVRLLVSAAPRETLRSIESAFGAAGVRVGLLAPATLALFDGLDSRLAAACGGDYMLLHRERGGATSLLIARSGRPLFYRQKSSGSGQIDESQEIRLSLSYYADTLGRGALSALYVCDEEPADEPFPANSPIPAEPLSPALLSADESLGLHAAARPEVWTAAAATMERI